MTKESYVSKKWVSMQQHIQKIVWKDQTHHHKRHISKIYYEKEHLYITDALGVS